MIDRTLTFREYVGDYQRQLFLIDHAGLPLKRVLDQLDLLGEIVPTLRSEFAAREPAHAPHAPTHQRPATAFRSTATENRHGSETPEEGADE
jgi:hypothetical protein